MRFLSMLILSFVPLLSSETLAEAIFDKKIDGVEYLCTKVEEVEICVWKQRPDWLMLSHDKDGNILINSGEPKDGRCWWLESEFGKKKQSVVSLLEVQCKQWRYRILQTTVFTKPMMEGKNKNVQNYDNGWRYPIPNTVGDVMLQLECDKFR